MNLIAWVIAVPLALWAVSTIVVSLWFWYEMRHTGDLPDQWTP